MKTIESSFTFKNIDGLQVQRFEAMLERMKVMDELTFVKWSSNDACSFTVNARSKERMAFVNGYVTALKGK